jgi:uncharacterized protein
MEQMLLLAAEKGDLSTVKAVITADVNVDCRDQYDRTPLMRAAKNGHAAVIEALVDNGAELNAKEKHFQTTPLMYAVDSTAIFT